MSGVPEIHRTELRGIPVFWADGPEPYHGELAFNVGSASETLATCGITHLVEHLACWATGKGPIQGGFGGWVDSVETSFWAEGTSDEVAEFLTLVAAGLSDLPLDRLEAERRVLSTEAASRGYSHDTYHRWLRFGARGHGLRFYREFGLRALGPEQVAGWTRERFGRENAALMFTGPPPAGLALDLPAVRRYPATPAELLRGLSLPASLAVGSDVSLSLVAKPSMELFHALWILERRLLTRLRADLAVTYSVSRDSGSLTGDLMHHSVCADCHPDASAVARDSTLTIIRELAARGPTAEELCDSVEALRTWVKDPFSIAVLLRRRVEAELVGSPRDDYLNPGRAPSSEAVAEALSSALTTGLLVVPENLEAVAEGFREYLPAPRRPIVGETYRAAGLQNLGADPRYDGVVIAGAGITVYWQGAPTTIHFEECEAMLRSSDGRRVLIGHDGTYMRLHPSWWRKGKEIVRAVDAGVPEDRVVPMEETTSRRGPASVTRRRSSP